MLICNDDRYIIMFAMLEVKKKPVPRPRQVDKRTVLNSNCSDINFGCIILTVRNPYLTFHWFRQKSKSHFRQIEPLGSFILNGSHGWMISSNNPLPTRKAETAKPKRSNITMNKKSPQRFFGFSVIFLSAILDLLKECHLKQ